MVRVKKVTDKNALEVAEEVNNMSYDKSRKSKAESYRSDLKKVTIICGAIDKAGKICTQSPIEGANRCKVHGGLSTGATTPEGRARSLANLDPRAHFIHGLYAHFTMTMEEATLYDTMMNHYIETLELDPANIMLMDRALRNFILNQRKERAELEEEINGVQFDIDYDSRFMKYMQTLGLDRKFNVSKEHKDNSSQGIAMLFMDEND